MSFIHNEVKHNRKEETTYFLSDKVMRLLYGNEEAGQTLSRKDKLNLTEDP